MALPARPDAERLSTRDVDPAFRDGYQMHATDDPGLHAPTWLSLVRVLPRLEQVTKVAARAIPAELIMATVNEVELPLRHYCL